MGILDELHKLGVNPGDNAPISVSLDRLTTAVHQAAKNIYGECTVDDPFKAPTHGLNKDGVPMIIFEYWTRHKEQPNDKYRVFGSKIRFYCTRIGCTEEYKLHDVSIDDSAVGELA